MSENLSEQFPTAYRAILRDTEAAGFQMASDPLTGSLLRTLAASKPAARFLELGTGTGLSTSWILEGMDANSTLVSVDNDEALLAIARQHLGHDPQLQLVCQDGGEWLTQNPEQRFDYIFADTWPGKYFYLEETLRLLRVGGFYLVDDMLPQPNWPEGHAEKASDLIKVLEQREDLRVTRLDWATGIIIGVKK